VKYKLDQKDLRKPGARYIRAVKFGGRLGRWNIRSRDRNLTL
jgi:hypothetical protein